MSHEGLINLEVLRRVQQSIIDNNSILENSNLSERIKQSIYSSEYSAKEINDTYARIKKSLEREITYDSTEA